MLTKTYLFLIAIVATLMGFTVTAHAATAIDPNSGGGVALSAFQAIYDAFTGGHYALAACSALVVAVALVRKYANVDFFHTDAGSAVLVLAGSFGTTMIAALAGGGPVSLHLVVTSFEVAFGAAGGYAALKAWVILPLAPKLPASWQPVILFLFKHASDTTDKTDPGNSAPVKDVPSA